jgi:uncharacterized protein YlxW (UPF0749 family)
MVEDSHEDRGRGRTWRVATPLVFALVGALFLVSGTNSDGTDLRGGRVTTMAGLVKSESERVAAQEAEAAAMRREVDRLAESVADKEVRRARDRAERLLPASGLTTVTGPGVTVTLSDAPPDVRDSSEQSINLLVVHQQDIQAVVNAMWRAGAEAITIQGQRIISTTGIKCAGSSVELQGIPYPQPYEITAIGDPARLSGELYSDLYVARYRAQSEQPDIAIGWDIETELQAIAPEYDGVVDLQYAEPAT